MTARNWTRDRTRQQAIRTAATRLPGLVNAAYDGTCPQCNHIYRRGDKIVRLPTGWGHPHCKQ